MNNILEIGNKCTGCTSCVAICPTKAISIKENEEGFLFPFVNEKRCISCGVCKTICPVLNNNTKNNVISCFAGWSNENEIIMKSSSGGIFSEVAKEFIKKGGYVAGVIIKENRAIHILSNKISDLENMRGSKYIQSNPKKILNEIIKLSKNKNILFVGTPCQVAGLRNLVSSKGNVKNVLFIELFCHGIPSFKVFDEYSRENKIISFRDKSTTGWENYCVKINSNSKERIIPFKEDKFMQTFLSDLCLRHSCYECKFSKSPGCSDITLGDYWGCSNNIKNNNGTSAIIINTKKGYTLIEDLEKQKKITLRKTTFSDISKGNPKISSGITFKPRRRKKFFKIINSKGLDYCYNSLVKSYLRKKKIRMLIKEIIERFRFRR